jgi:hypothetical protein
VRSYDASCVIRAEPAQVWAILTDGARYPDWASGVARVEGTIALGERIKVVSRTHARRAVPVRVTELVPEEQMTWVGGMPFDLFTSIRTFTVRPDRSTTQFAIRERYTGTFLPLIWRSMPDLEPSFCQFADGLKQRAEARSEDAGR